MKLRAAGALPLVILGLGACRADALTMESARHLLARAGFGATPAEIAALLPLTREQAVDLLLFSARTDPVTPLPAWASQYLAPPRPDPRDPAAAKAAREAYDAALSERRKDLLAWWYGEMIATDSPLTERMVLFWHGHFTSALEKVNVPDLMLQQNLLLRREALGSFAEMVHAIARDAAMLIYLDGESNVKAHPNENFARELMELFTLGEGHYTETDVRETARAFTGWRVDNATGRVSFDPKRHDDGIKTILGRTGDWDGDAAIRIILGQPEAASFIVTELWREFISPTPDPRVVDALAAQFRGTGYQVRPLMRALFLTDAFWSPSNWGTLVKSPVVLAVGTARLLGLGPSDATPVANAVYPMGEQLFNPPTVKGWPTGDAWITSSTLVARERALRRLPRKLIQQAADTLQTELHDLQARHAISPSQGMETLILPVPVISPPSTGSMSAGADAAAGTLSAILLNPLYELM